MGRLTRKRKVFIEEYLKCWNGAEAARRAGYRFPRRQASYLLTILDIADEIERRIAEKAMSADEVLTRLAEIGRAEYSQYLKNDGTVNLAQLLAGGKGHLVKGIKETKYGKQVEFYDSQRALVDIGKHHGLFTEYHQSQNLNIDMAQLTDEQLRRIAKGESPANVLSDTR